MQPDEIIIDVVPKSHKPLLIKIGLVLTVFCLVWGVMAFWKVPTRVSLEVPVNRVEWTLGLFPSQQILNPLLVESIALQQFGSLDLNPTSLEVTDAGRESIGNQEDPPSGWESVTVFGDVRFTPVSPDSEVRFQPVHPSERSLGILGAIKVREESNVILEVVQGEPHTIRLSILGPESHVEFTPRQPFDMHSSQTEYAGLKEFRLIHKPALVFRPRLPEHRPSIEIKGNKQRLVMTLRISPSDQPHVISQQPIPIKAIDFTRIGLSGQALSALTGPARLRFPDFSQAPENIVLVSNRVQVEPLQILTIRGITMRDGDAHFLITLDGMAKSILSGTNEEVVDHRVPLGEHLWNELQRGQ